MEGKLQQLDDPYVGALSDSGKENLWQNQGQGGEPRSAGSEGRTTGIQKNPQKNKQPLYKHLNIVPNKSAFLTFKSLILA